MLCQHPFHLRLGIRQAVAIIPKLYYANKSKIEPEIKKDENVRYQQPLGPNFFARNIGSTYLKWSSILNNYPKLKYLKSKDVVNTMNILRKLDYSLDDILTMPMILYTNELTVENRHKVLKESGIENITLKLLSKYVTIVNRNVVNLKSVKCIPYSLDVVEQLRHTFTDIEVKLCTKYACNESLKLKMLRQHILTYYLQQRLDMSDEDIGRVWNTYKRLKHKSFYSVQNMVEILLNDLKFPKDRIIKNGFILHGDPNNVRRIINEIPKINGQDIKEILFSRPKIMMSSCDSLLSTIEHITSFGISEEAVLKCLEVLTLGPDTVLERLKDLYETKEFRALTTNPRILKLVHYQNKARLRLNYLNKIKVKCASLHILSCGSEAFAKFARDGSERIRGRDTVVHLAKILDKPKKDIRNLMSRHPNWCDIPLSQVYHCLDYLLSMKFKKEDIYNNIHLLLYSTKQINNKLKLLQTPEFLKTLEIDENIENIDILCLVLYLIERDFHFTGDGVWTEQHDQPVENFTNLLPDFPESVNKIYKYGRKPAGSTAEAIKTDVGGFI